jgi:hypothetical protein
MNTGLFKIRAVTRSGQIVGSLKPHGVTTVSQVRYVYIWELKCDTSVTLHVCANVFKVSGRRKIKSTFIVNR